MTYLSFNSPETKEAAMKPQAYLTYEDQTQIAARARKLRAEAVAQAATAVKIWIRTHLSFGTAHKA